VKSFAECTNEYIDIDFEHIFGMFLKYKHAGGIRISGFHHDLMNAVEKSGVMQFLNKKFGMGGIYKVDLVVNGYTTEKTFFPAYWPQQKVVEKIHEAYEYAKQRKGSILLSKNGIYRLEGKTDCGITIEMFLTKDAQITTAYPLLK
jgi:Bacterial EndoU nuclease